MKRLLLFLVAAMLAVPLSAQTEQEYNEIREAARLRQLEQQREQAQQERKQKKDLKPLLESNLVGKSVTPQLRIGRTATLRQGAGVDHAVTTVVYPDSGEVRYRAEGMFGGVDVDRGDYNLTYFAESRFRIDKLDFKGDRLELRLQSVGGESAKLKLILGKDWQSTQDASEVLTKLGSIFGSERATEVAAAPVSQPPAPTVTNSPDSQTTIPQAPAPPTASPAKQSEAATPNTGQTGQGSAQQEELSEAKTLTEAQEGTDDEQQTAMNENSTADLNPQPTQQPVSSPVQQPPVSTRSSEDVSGIAVWVVIGGVIALVVLVWVRKRAKMRKLEEEEMQRQQEFWQEVKEERESTKAEFKEVIEKFDLLLGLGEDSWGDFIQALNEHEGTSYTEEMFPKIINADVLSILKHVSSVTGDTVRCGRIYQAVFSLLYPYECFTVAMCMAVFSTVRTEPVKLPFVVKAFGDFPHVHGENAAVTLGKCAASAFKWLVLTAFGGKPTSAEAATLCKQYLDLLEPYTPEDHSKQQEPSSSTRSENSRPAESIPTCPECSGFYAVLRLNLNATEEQIKTAYRDLVQIYHPDRFDGNDRVRRTAEEEMKKVNAAYQHIMGHFEPVLRADGAMEATHGN